MPRVLTLDNNKLWCRVYFSHCTRYLEVPFNLEINVFSAKNLYSLFTSFSFLCSLSGIPIHPIGLPGLILEFSHIFFPPASICFLLWNVSSR